MAWPMRPLTSSGVPMSGSRPGMTNEIAEHSRRNNPLMRLRSDEAVDLAVAEQPLSVLFDQLVLIGSARADLWPLRAVLYDCPIRAHARARPVQRNRDVSHQMDPARPLISCPFPQTACQIGYGCATGCPAEGGVPGTGFGEQRRHLGEPAVIEPEAIFGQDFSDCVLLFDRGGHPFPPA